MVSLPDPLRPYIGALNVAAYLTWAVILVLLLDTPQRFLLHTRLEALGCLVAFLVVFVVKQSRDGDRIFWLLLGLEGVLALLACVFWSPTTVAPILTIVFIVDCGLALSARALLAVGVGVNLALWSIATEVWNMSGAWRVIIAYAAFQLFAALTAWYSRRAQEVAAQLREANAHLLATRSLLEESARDHERLRLARELHDVAGHKLTALKLNLTALQREGGGGSSVDSAAQLATDLLADIRGVVAQIRQHDGLDIRDALTQLVAHLPAPPRVHLAIQEHARAGSVAQAETLLRVVQEALTNSMRHSGARNVWVELVREDAHLRLRVHDDGRVSLPLTEGFGLAGMRERLAQLSGRLDISHAAQGGLALDIHLPLQA